MQEAAIFRPRPTDFNFPRVSFYVQHRFQYLELKLFEHVDDQHAHDGVVFDYKVLEADGSEAALVLLEDTGLTIDLLMTDVGLPGMDGKQLAARARELRPSLPILFASGYAENIEVPPGMSVIGKPFSIDQLRDKVRSILA